MASIIGKGALKAYSKIVKIHDPMPVACLPGLMKLPEKYRDNIIAVKDGKVLSRETLLKDDDEILVFISVMGG